MKVLFENKLLLIGVLVILYFITIIPLIKWIIKRIEKRRNELEDESNVEEVDSGTLVGEIVNKEKSEYTGTTLSMDADSNKEVLLEGLRKILRKYYVLDEDEIFDTAFWTELHRSSVIRTLIRKISENMRNGFLKNMDIYGISNQEVEAIIKDIEEETFKLYNKND